MKNKKAVIFDLDGTMLDTMADIASAVNRALASFGAPVRTQEEVVSFIGNGSLMLIRRALPEGCSDEECIAVRERFREEYFGGMYEQTAPYAGMCELISELAAMGVTVAVVTNKDDRCAVPMIKHYFGTSVHYVRGIRDDSERKPSPKNTLEFLQKFGLSPEEALFVGDGMADVRTARNCGIEFIPVGYGYTDKALLFAECNKEIAADVASLRNKLLAYF